MRGTWPTNPDARCAECGNPCHSLFAFIKGWLCWHLIVRPWPARWGIPPLLAHAGDWIFDARGCDHQTTPGTHMTDNLAALAGRVEQAEGPSRELDAEIAPLQGLRIVDEGHPLGRVCYDTHNHGAPLPAYTASLDAAMTLVPEGWTWGCDSEGGAAIFAPDKAMHLGRAATPALALAAAALRAKGSQ